MKLFYKQILITGLALGVMPIVSACSDNQTPQTQQQSNTYHNDLEFFASLEPSQVPAITINVNYDNYADVPNFVALITKVRKLETQSKYQEAFNTWQEIIALCDETLPSDDVRFVPLLLAGAKNASSLSSHDEGLILITRVTNIIDDKPGFDYEQAYIRARLSDWYSETGEVETMKKVLDEALQYIDGKDDQFSQALRAQLVFGLGNHLHLTGHYLEGAQKIQESLDIQLSLTGPNNIDIPSTRLALAGMLSSARDPRAMALAKKALESAQNILPPTSPELAKAMEVMGLELQRSGRLYEASLLFPEAIRIKSQTLGKDHLYVSYAVNNLASIYANIGKYQDSERLYLQAHEGFLKSQGEDSMMAANALRSAAAGSFRLGKAELALEYRQQGSRTIDALLPYSHRDNYRMRIGLVENLIALERHVKAFDEATKMLQGAQKALPKEHEELLVAKVYYHSAAYMKSPNQTDQQKAFAAADAIIAKTELSYNFQGGEKLTGILRASLGQAAALSAQSGQPENFLKYLQARDQGSVNQAVKAIVSRRQTDNEALGIFIRQRQNTVEALKKKEREYFKAFAKQAGNVGEIKASLIGMRKNLAAMNLTMKEMYPDFASLSQNKTYNVAEIQSTLLADDMALIIDGTSAHFFVMAITKNKAGISHDPLASPVVDNLVRSISKSTHTGTPFARADAHALYEIIFNQDISPLLDGVNHVKVFSTGTLANLPLSLLVADEKNLHYLGEDVAITVLPSLASLTISNKPMGAGQTQFLGIGDPALSPQIRTTVSVDSDLGGGGFGSNVLYRGAEISRDALLAFPRLPNTKKELKKIASNFKRSKLLLGNSATETKLKAMDLSKYNLISFATHGVVAGEIIGQGEPGLILTPPKTPSSIDDGLLTSSEIINLSLNADWVVLSACNTAAGDTHTAGAYTGLARAFLYAGADSLLVSHWPVRDDAASILTVSTVQNTEAGMSKAKALQTAMIDLMNNLDVENASHPAIWAPFVLVGN